VAVCEAWEDDVADDVVEDETDAVVDDVGEDDVELPVEMDVELLLVDEDVAVSILHERIHRSVSYICLLHSIP
jgi:hypothetical protein